MAGCAAFSVANRGAEPDPSASGARRQHEQYDGPRNEQRPQQPGTELYGRRAIALLLAEDAELGGEQREQWQQNGQPDEYRGCPAT